MELCCILYWPHAVRHPKEANIEGKEYIFSMEQAHELQSKVETFASQRNDPETRQRVFFPVVLSPLSENLNET